MKYVCVLLLQDQKSFFFPLIGPYVYFICQAFKVPLRIVGIFGSPVQHLWGDVSKQTPDCLPAQVPYQ